ncbi:MAG: dihydroorotase [Candidatus Dadabacteria bacterium RIFCSPHIGHO2_12_FULL_53_21]|nr:MAG: dihydroorotase [Candidatus Dadabacteria bacterium RIFCSPHIGHO2_12_FULL_53_21]
MSILIKGGRIIDPSRNFDKVGNILIEKGTIKSYPEDIKKLEKDSAIKVIEAGGKIVAPGLVDLHVHLREPGYEHKETIRTGCESAAAGGFTSIVCMPNTNPINDNASVTEYIMLKARTEGVVNVYPLGAITKGENGETLAQIGEMYEAGCVGVTDDGMPVMNSKVMRHAMEYVKAFGIPVISHCEDLNLSGNGVMNEGDTSTLLGLSGIPAASEDVMVSRDITLAELTGTHLHICHVSTKGSVRLIRAAKERGVRVTAEAAPHHFTLTDKAVAEYDTNAKMKPPLRSEIDREAVREGLRDGTIDVIATDHAPHSEDEKMVEFDLAPFGIVGLETALPLSLKLVEDGVLTLNGMIAKLTHLPSAVINIRKGTLNPGGQADIVIFDPERKVKIDRERFRSKSKNTPFNGWDLKGVVLYTIVNGNIVYSV